MKVEDVGGWNFCPMCARPLVDPSTTIQGGNPDEFEDWICSCCDRPWIACPCTPASEGACRSGEDRSVVTPVKVTIELSDKVFVGLAHAGGEFSWPGYARQPIMGDERVEWVIPTDLLREQVIGPTCARYSAWNPWGLLATGLLYFTEDGQPYKGMTDVQPFTRGSLGVGPSDVLAVKGWNIE